MKEKEIPNGKTLDFGSIFSNANNDLTKAIENIQGSLANLPPEIRNLSLAAPKRISGKVPLHLHGNQFHQINMGQAIDTLSIENFEALHCIINQEHPRSVSIKDANIVNLSVGVKARTSLTLVNCKIGRLTVESGSVRDMSIKNCLILDMKVPPPDDVNPVSGSVEIDHESHFSTYKSDDRMFRGAQCYTSFRSHLETLENAPMAALFRALELKAELQNDRGLNRIANRLYGISANYGLSPGKPLAIAVAIYAAMVVAIFIWDDGSTGLSPDRYKGYLSGLLGQCTLFVDTQYGPEICLERLARSAFLPFQSIGGPIVFFSANKLVVANYIWTSGALVLQGIFTDIMIFISILSIRRRFKLT